MSKSIYPILIAGIGNPLLSDDTAGLLAIDMLENKIAKTENVVLKKLYCGGFDLVTEIASFTTVIIIDCIIDSAIKPGEIKRFLFSSQDSMMEKSKFAASSHGIDLNDVLKTGTLLGYAMPTDVIVYGIGGADVTTFNESPREPVKQAIHSLIGIIENDLKNLRPLGPQSEAKPV